MAKPFVKRRQDQRVRASLAGRVVESGACPGRWAMIRRRLAERSRRSASIGLDRSFLKLRQAATTTTPMTPSNVFANLNRMIAEKIAEGVAGLVEKIVQKRRCPPSRAGRLAKSCTYKAEGGQTLDSRLFSASSSETCRADRPITKMHPLLPSPSRKPQRSRACRPQSLRAAAERHGYLVQMGDTSRPRIETSIN